MTSCCLLYILLGLQWRYTEYIAIVPCCENGLAIPWDETKKKRKRIYIIRLRMLACRKDFIFRGKPHSIYEAHTNFMTTINRRIIQSIFSYLLFSICSFQSIERIPEKLKESEEDDEEESKFCTLPRSNNGFTIRQVCLQHFSSTYRYCAGLRVLIIGIIEKNLFKYRIYWIFHEKSKC